MNVFPIFVMDEVSIEALGTVPDRFAAGTLVRFAALKVGNSPDEFN